MNTARVVPISSVARSPEIRQSAVAFRELMRLLGGGAGLRDTNEAVAFPPELARYGFGRLPATFAELFALFEYCDSLDAASGVGMRPDGELAEWQAASFVVWRRKSPQLMPAIELYCAGDIDALRAMHREQDTLTALGLRYLQAED
jgi:hypothetical protein